MALGLDTDNNCEICGTGSAGMWVCKTCASKIVESAPSASVNTGSPKLPRFEELWDAYCDEYKFGDDASEHETCLSFYDIIARQLRAGA